MALRSYREYGRVRMQTYLATDTDDDLFDRLGDAFICGVTVGNNAADDVDLKVGSIIIYRASAQLSGTRETVFLTHPISTRVIDGGTADTLVADVTVGAQVTLLYFVLP